jgi:hypothetical protein
MAKPPFIKDSQFIVGEEKVLNYVLASLFFGLFIYGLVDAIVYHFTKINYLNIISVLLLVPAILFFRRGKSDKIYIRVNKTGIYQDEKLLTRWSNFINAYISQKEKMLSIQDNFILVIEYRKDGVDKGFRRKIPLTNTQNKSEEEVLEAVKFFWSLYRNDAGV